MARLLVCVTFDFDAMSGLMARGLTTPNYISRGEFGPVAIPRILDLLKKYGVKSTFFSPGFTIETYPAQNEAILEAGHEIGHHGWTHLPPHKMTREQEEANLVRGNETIKKLTGKYARGYRSPSWDLSENSVDLLVKHGFVYESSLMGNDYTPYRCRQGDVVDIDKPLIFGNATRLIEIPIAWSLDDFPHFEFLRMETRDADHRLLDAVDTPFRNPLFSAMARSELEIEMHPACATARRVAAPQFSRSYFVPQPNIGLQVE